MIEELQEADIEETAKVYLEGLFLEIPPGKSNLDEIKKYLSKSNCLIYKKNNKIIALCKYDILKKSILIKFICTLEQRKGIGTQLIKKLAEKAKEQGKVEIISTVSTIDERTLSFYKRIGFVKYGIKISGDLLLNKVRLTI